MADIQLPKPEFQRGEIKIGLNLKDYLPKNEKKSLANLGDAELAELSPEELEQAKKAKENLLGIKKVDMEVRQMENQEQWNQQVQALAQTHSISVDEAELLLKRRMGVEKPSDFMAMMQMMQSKPSPIDEAFSKAVAQRMDQIVGTMFPSLGTGGANVTGQGTGTQENPIVGLLEKAKAAGVQSLYLPDGTVLNLGEAKKSEGEIGDTVYKQVTEHVDNLIKEGLPRILNPPENKSGVNLQSLGTSPEVARLWFEDKWKDEERKAEDVRAQGRNETLQSIAAAVGAMFSPEGYKKVQKILKEGIRPGASEPEAGAKSETKARLLKTTCRRCMRVFPYEEGKEPVCPYCATYQKVECPGCGEIFTPEAGKEMVCPKCGAQLEQPPPQAKEEERTPETESPAVTVGGGLLE